MLFLKFFKIFTRKHLRLSLFLIKLQSFRAANLLKRDSNTGVFLWTFSKTPILKNICEQLLLYLTDFSEQLLFGEAIFYNSLSNMFISSSYFTFVSVHISLNIFITCRDCIYVHCDKEINSWKFRILLMYVFSFTGPVLIKESTKNPPY